MQQDLEHERLLSFKTIHISTQKWLPSCKYLMNWTGEVKGLKLTLFQDVDIIPSGYLT